MSGCTQVPDLADPAAGGGATKATVITGGREWDSATQPLPSVATWARTIGDPGRASQTGVAGAAVPSTTAKTPEAVACRSVGAGACTTPQASVGSSMR